MNISYEQNTYEYVNTSNDLASEFHYSNLLNRNRIIYQSYYEKSDEIMYMRDLEHKGIE